MTRLTTTLAALFVLSASSAAFAAPRYHMMTQGDAYNICRDELYPEGGFDDHHKGPEIRACVNRVEHGGRAVD